MSFIEVSIQLEPYLPYSDVLIALLGELGYDSFMEEESDHRLKAYIPESEWDEKQLKASLLALAPSLSYSYEIKVMEKENWNRKWESNFDPVEVDSFCRVRAPFHPHKAGFNYELIIEPKMSFGTGHHQTTQLMMTLMQELNLNHKRVLDMGSGTGILAILAVKMKATRIDAIDIEDWAFENMKENFQRNHCADINAYLGDADILKDKEAQYDIILANINKNIILADIEHYHRCLVNSGHLVISGFLREDEGELIKVLETYHFKKLSSLHKDKWMALNLRKEEI